MVKRQNGVAVLLSPSPRRFRLVSFARRKAFARAVLFYLGLLVQVLFYLSLLVQVFASVYLGTSKPDVCGRAFFT